MSRKFYGNAEGRAQYCWPVTIRGVAIGLTIWFATAAVFGAIASPTHLSLPSALEIRRIFSFYLLPVRWLLVLTLLIRRARTRASRWLPTPIKIVLLIFMQLVLGLLSFIGFYTLASEQTGRTGERVFGLFLHVVIPAAMVAYLARRPRI